jgi:glycosyltransferase involved in cell wall biosynthesis
MATVSLTAVVHDEESEIEEFLGDARPWVDEIVVVDQSSTDGTVELAARWADVIVSDEHHGFPEPSRALAAARAYGDWLLVLDADERMTQRLKQALRGLVARYDLDGYRIRQEFYIDGRLECGGATHYRLFRRDRVRFLAELHTEPQAVSSKWERIDWIGIVHHKTLADQLADEARYERIVLATERDPALREAKLALNVRLAAARAARAAP